MPQNDISVIKQLVELGYTNTQAKVLANKNRFAEITKYHQYFTTQYHFSHEQIYKAIKANLSNLYDINFNYKKLREEMNLDNNTIVKLYSAKGGSLFVPQLIKAYPQLQEKGYAKELDPLFTNSNSGELLNIVLNYDYQCEFQKITKDFNKPVFSEITFLPHEINAILKSQGFQEEWRTPLIIPALDYNLTPSEMAHLLGHDGGLLDYKSFLKNSILLRMLCFSRKQILGILSKGSGHKLVDELITYSNYNLLIKCYSHSKIAEFYASKSGISTQFIITQLAQAVEMPNSISQIKRLQQQNSVLAQKDMDIEKLCETGEMTRQQVLMIAGNAGLEGIQALEENYATLRTIGYSVALIMELSNHKGGKSSILAILQFHDILHSQFSLKQIIKIAACAGGACNIEAVAQHKDFLFEFLFIEDIAATAEHIKSIAEGHGGRNRINDLVVNHEHFKKANLSPLQIINYYKVKYNANGPRKAEKFLALHNYYIIKPEVIIPEALQTTVPSRKRSRDNESSSSTAHMPYSQIEADEINNLGGYNFTSNEDEWNAMQIPIGALEDGTSNHLDINWEQVTQLFELNDTKTSKKKSKAQAQLPCIDSLSFFSGSTASTKNNDMSLLELEPAQFIDQHFKCLTS